MKPLKLTVVVDNNVPPGAKAPFRGEHGLALLIDTGTNRILFDAGPSDVVVHNLGLLGLHPRDLDAIVLSHGHYDHTGGLPSVLMMAGKTIPVFSHPGIFTQRYSVVGAACRYVGIPFTRDYLTSIGADFRSVEGPQELLPNIWISGPGPSNTMGPAFPPANTGKPKVPRSIQIITLSAPISAPRIAPASSTTNGCNVIGTGPMGRMMYELTQSSEAKSDTSIFLRRDMKKSSL